jgi:hypothetical protein
MLLSGRYLTAGQHSSLDYRFNKCGAQAESDPFSIVDIIVRGLAE